MGLTPLEYLDCFLDSPAFRENLMSYEKELENNSVMVKNLTKECRRLIQATEDFSKVQQSFAHTMKNFKFEIIGETQTQEEIMITESLKQFADVLLNIEEQRCIMLSTISARMLDTLERFRKENMQQAKDEKRKFEKVSEKYYNSLERYLSQKKKDIQQQHEFDSALFKDQAAFQQTSFQYACQLQDVHASKQYELIEPILGYIGDVTTFLHQAYDTALSTKPQLERAQFRIQLLRETHKEEQEKAYELKAKIIEEGKQGLLHHPQYVKQGFLMVQEKRIGGLTHSWTRYFCQFNKSDDVQFLRLIPIGQHNKPEFYQVKQCTRCKTDEIDRRYCIEVEIYVNRTESLTKRYFMQAISQPDMKEWLEVMEGKEPTYATMPAPRVTEVKILNYGGYEFITKCTQALEKRGLTEEGIYRKPGVMSKATALMKDCVEKKRTSKISLDDEIEYDTKTVASAVKMYFSKQISEPLMTYALYDSLIEAAKTTEYDSRIVAITQLVNKLPPLNFRVLVDFVNHLSVVACNSNFNLMQASNLGVVFGPTLIRPEVETVARIKDIKYQNIIVEMMIDEKDKIFIKGNIPEVVQVVQQPTSQDAPYDTLDGVNLATSQAATALPSSRMTPSSSDDNLLSKATTSSGSSLTKQDVDKADSFENKPNYAIPPRRAAPRPPIHKKPVRSYTLETISVPTDKDATTNATSPVTEKTPPSFKHLNSLPAPQPESKSPQMPRKHDSLQMPRKNDSPQMPRKNDRTSGSDGNPMRLRAATSAFHTPAEKIARSPKFLSEKKRIRSDSGVADEQVDKNDNRFANRISEDEAPPIPWRTGTSRRARTLYDCDSDDPNELNFKKGQILMDVKPSDEPGWLQASLNDKIGLVPENYIELLS